MNNYCTNCGEKLKPYSEKCYKCGTAVLDIPSDYKHEHIKKSNFKKKLAFTFGITIVVILTLLVARKLYVKVMSNKLMNEYAIPYLENIYGKYYSNLEFDMYGKCIISGDCYTEPLIKCDGNGCEVYSYLSRFKCMSFFYTFDVGEESREITVFKKDGKYQVVGGRNIYGYLDDLSDNYYDYDNYDDEELLHKSFFIKDDKYESDFIALGDNFNYNFMIHDKGELIVEYDNRFGGLDLRLYSNSLYNIVTIKGYNSNYEEVGVLNLTKSEYGDDYSFEDDLSFDIEYLKVFVGEKYE